MPRMLETLRETFWILALAVIALFAFFAALGAFSPLDVLWATVAVGVLCRAVDRARHARGPAPRPARPDGRPRPRAPRLLGAGSDAPGSRRPATITTIASTIRSVRTLNASHADPIRRLERDVAGAVGVEVGAAQRAAGRVGGDVLAARRAAGGTGACHDAGDGTIGERNSIDTGSAGRPSSRRLPGRARSGDPADRRPDERRARPAGAPRAGRAVARDARSRDRGAERPGPGGRRGARPRGPGPGRPDPACACSARRARGRSRSSPTCTAAAG